MRSIVKFSQLPCEDRSLLLKTLPLVAGIRLALWVLPFESTRRLVARLAADKRSEESRVIPAAKLAWAVGAVARRIPAASCLTQALALHVLCRRNGHPTDVQIGVNRDERNSFRAHAWVESDGEILIGRLADLSAFLPLPSLGL